MLKPLLILSLLSISCITLRVPDLPAPPPEPEPTAQVAPPAELAPWYFSTEAGAAYGSILTGAVALLAIRAKRRRGRSQ